MRKWLKIRASAMQFAIVISVLIALLLSGFLLFTYTYSSFSTRSEEVITIIETANSGITYSAENNHGDSSDSINIFIGETSVTLKESYWGSFQKVFSKAKGESSSFSKIALLGGGFMKESPAIYLEDNQMPLVLAGNTRIEGLAFTPDNIVKAGSVGGHYYLGDRLIYGRRHSSGAKLPSLDVSWRNQTWEMLTFVPIPEHQVVELNDIRNSFFAESKVIYQEQKIFLTETLTGNIIIKSEEQITAGPWAELDQALLIAPKVVIQKGFNGNIQVIAEKIIVEDGVVLNYPSSLIVFEKNNQVKEHYNFVPKIQIGKHVLFQGNILYLKTTEDNRSKRDLVLEENSVVEGSIYCEGYMELKGTVKGSIYTKYFSASHSGSIYINHIFNGKVITTGVKEERADFLLEDSQKQIATWLY